MNKKPEQLPMFRDGELAQFGVRANPQASLSPATRLVLVMQDWRTPDEIAADKQRNAEDATYPMFPQEVE